MTYRLKVALVAGFAAVTVSLSAALAVWSVNASERHIQQAELAHSLLNEHLQLSVHAYRLFKQLTDEILLGSAANQSIVRNKRAAIAGSLARIRVLELEQRKALGPELAPGAVEDTDDLERQIEAIIAEFGQILNQPVGPARAQQVSKTLEDRIDIGFREAVNAALERQQRVVLRMNQQVNAVHQRQIGLSIGLVLATVFGALAMGWLLHRGIAVPLDSLHTAAQAWAGGDLRHRVPAGFDVEFDRIATTFNGMAERLAEHEHARERTQRELEAAVLERTQELSAANQALQRADAVRRQFFADVSHELRTPLTVIRGEAQVALRGKPRSAEDYREALSVVVEQAVGLSRLVDDMLFIARTDAERIRINRRAIDLRALVDEVAHELSGLAAPREVHIDAEFDSDMDSVIADPDRVRQLLVILLDNAIRFSPSGGRVRVEMVQEADQWSLSVADQGPGIDSQDLPYIFDRFFKAQTDRTDNSQGLGLGLAVAKAIVTAHDGDISVRSEPGKGTQIRARFPVSA